MGMLCLLHSLSEVSDSQSSTVKLLKRQGLLLIHLDSPGVNCSHLISLLFIYFLLRVETSTHERQRPVKKIIFLCTKPNFTVEQCGPF